MAAQGRNGDGAKELELCDWYLEENESEVRDEAQLRERCVKRGQNNKRGTREEDR